VIGQGTWDLHKADPRLALTALRRGIDLGMNHIDTGEMYGAGACEELVGEAIAGRREDVFLVSKVMTQNASRWKTQAACEGSLSRLRTDRLDCYLLYWRGKYPLEESIAALENLVRDGKILSWGVSNFDIRDLEAALAVAGEGRIACNQVLYNLDERGVEHAVIPWSERHGVAFMAYSPLGQQRFPGPASAGGRALADIARAHDAAPRQVALAFLTRWPSAFAIPRATNLSHTQENAGASALHLSDDEIERIDAAFPRGPLPRTLPML
jgi:diketogulonate reductase-like aldo/keto reductase